jgi:hypothetical protein
MRLSVKALMWTGGLAWGGAMLLAGLGHLVVPGYAEAFLQAMGSLYPGFHAGRSLGDVLVGAGYALVDGGIGGLFVGWLYNLFAGRAAA